MLFYYKFVAYLLQKISSSSCSYREQISELSKMWIIHSLYIYLKTKWNFIHTWTHIYYTHVFVNIFYMFIYSLSIFLSVLFYYSHPFTFDVLVQEQKEIIPNHPPALLGEAICHGPWVSLHVFSIYAKNARPWTLFTQVIFKDCVWEMR